MSDSAHQGDAARLEAALERIVQALGRAAPPPNQAAPDLPAPGPAATPDSVVPFQVPAAAPAEAFDVAVIGARLDGLIAELRDVLGEDGEPPGDAPAQS